MIINYLTLLQPINLPKSKLLLCSIVISIRIAIVYESLRNQFNLKFYELIQVDILSYLLFRYATEYLNPVTIWRRHHICVSVMKIIIFMVILFLELDFTVRGCYKL